VNKLIVTHFNPDLDAICAVWLFRKFTKEFQRAQVVFVPAGETYKNHKVDEDENIVHVDTGLGKFDHHQLNSKTCASKLVFNWLKSKKNELADQKALIQLIEVVRQIDHFEECLWPEPRADRYNFSLDQLLDGLKNAGKIDDQGLIELGLKCLNGVYSSLKIKNRAYEELKEGVIFETKWGKAIGCLSSVSEVLKLGQKQGFVLVVQKDSNTEHVRIKARPDSKVNLEGIKENLKKLDSDATWFLHSSGRMLLNGSTKNFKMKPSTLSLKKIIEVISNEF